MIVHSTFAQLQLDLVLLGYRGEHFDETIITVDRKCN